MATDADSQYICNNSKCGKVWWSHEIIHERVREHVGLLCPACRWGVSQIIEPTAFWKRMPGAFVFPFRGNGVWILAIGTPVLAVLDFVRAVSGAFLVIGFLIFVVALLFLLGFFGGLLLDVIRVTASDETRTMEWPDITLVQEIVGTASQFIGSLLIVFGPVLACAVKLWWVMMDFGADADIALWKGTTLTLLLAGIVYYPMAMVGVAMLDSLAGVNPLRVLPAIWKTKWHYLLVLVLLLVLLALRKVVALTVMHLPVWGQVAAFLPVEFFAFYTFVVSARLLGLLYVANENRLGWFSW